MDINAQNRDAVESLTNIVSALDGDGSFEGPTTNLDQISVSLARDVVHRNQIGSSQPSIWPALTAIWRALSVAEADEHTLAVLLSIARFTRNLTPGCPENQVAAFECEPFIREVIFKYTSFYAGQDLTTHQPTRFAIQALSNTVTSNEELLSRLSVTYLSLPEERNILYRILGHPDKRTVVAGLVLISNCTTKNKERVQSMITSATRLFVLLLDLLSAEAENEETADGTEVFEIGWSILREVFRLGLGLVLFEAIKIEGEVITPHQTTLFKVLDSYLLHHELVGEEITLGFMPLLIQSFFALSGYACQSISRSLESGGAGTSANASMEDGGNDRIASSISDGTVAEAPTKKKDDTLMTHVQPLQQFDVLLPKISQTIVLVVQCLCTIALGNERIHEHIALQAKSLLIGSTDTAQTKSKIGQRASDAPPGLIERLIELLRRLDQFIPRVILGKPSWSDGRPTPATSSQDSSGEVDMSGFNHLKRDLVRLLGILCYDVSSVQDRVRECGGIPVVMNLCVTDERNPYLREHALFALRNLLKDNASNQGVVDAIRPTSRGQPDTNWF